QLMQDQLPHLDPKLTLRDLAEQMGMPANQLSQLLNMGFQQNFAEFVNSYRLQTFKEKVANPKLHHLTLLALAYDSGFNSKTVFNTFFKKKMGMTPRTYWKQVIKG
ncbi:MAG: AraC family transcriptional regulator, partial [Bacteroidota bacterium]